MDLVRTVVNDDIRTRGIAGVFDRLVVLKELSLSDLVPLSR